MADFLNQNKPSHCEMCLIKKPEIYVEEDDMWYCNICFELYKNVDMNKAISLMMKVNPVLFWGRDIKNLPKSDTRINKFFCSHSVSFFISRMEKLYNIVCVNDIPDVYDENEPYLFMGIYNNKDIEKLLNHKGLAVVLWCGGDIINVSKIPDRDNIKHIAIGHWVEESLIKNNKKYKVMHVCFEYNDIFKPCVLGDKVYCYASNEIYGLSLAKEIAKEIPFEVIFTDKDRKYNPEELDKLYSQCFIGMRLRKENDGNSATVQGMSFKGIRSIWNGDNPLAIKWETKQDIINAIMEESKKIGTMQESLAKEAQGYFAISLRGDWMKKEFYI